MIITVIENAKKVNIAFEKGEILYNVLVRSGYGINAPCGGRGTCGKCLVEVNGDMVHACKIEAEDGMIVRLSELGESKILTDGTHTEVSADGSGLGIALDMGTTTVAACLFDLSTGEKMGTYAGVNKQKSYGADVISRSENSEKMHRIAVEQINEVVDFFGREVNKIFVSGNTIMQHFVLGFDARPITTAPFTPSTTALEIRNGKELGIRANALHVLPCISGYVGADIVMGIISTGIYKSEKPCILLDIGTNGEIAVGSKSGIYCCSAAAGPAFEGANISCGMSGIEGAVNTVKIDNGNILFETIGNKPPQGICGSGILDAVAEFLKSGIIDETGYLEDNVDICDNVVITPKDIREVQLAKAAIAAGINTLLKKTGITLEEIDTLYLAGGFGNYLDKHSAARVGLIPKGIADRVKPIGNSSLAGCRMTLLDSEYENTAVKIAQSAHYIELSCDVDFQTEYIEQMMF